MQDDKMVLLTKATEVMNKMDETQCVLEGMAYDILNCSDSIHNSIVKLIGLMKEVNVTGEQNKNQTFDALHECLEELSTYSENMCMCAHQNEEAFSNQHEAIEEIKSIFMDNHYDLF